MKQKKQKQEDTEMNDENLVFETSEEIEVVKTFDDLGLREELLRGKLDFINWSS